MKTKILILWLFICGAIMPLYSQTYSEADINELKLIAKRTDFTGALNWLSDRPYEWQKVVWKEYDGIKKVYKLNLNFCNLSGELDLRKLDKLEVVYCYNNQLRKIYTPETELFEILYCQNNNLEPFGLSVFRSKNLEELFCQGNEWLAELDLTKNTKLINVNCSDCRNLNVIKFPVGPLNGYFQCNNTGVGFIDLTNTDCTEIKII